MNVPRSVANHFGLSAEGITVTYDSSGIDGKPSLTYQKGGKTWSFRGEALTRLSTPLGTLVTVQLEAVPDLRTVNFSVFLPEVELPSNSAEVGITVPGLITTSDEAQAGPRRPMTYILSNMKGTASLAYSLA